MGQSKYPTITKNQLIQILQAQGFDEINTHNKGDHRFFVKYVNGRKYLTQVDNGCPEYGKDLIPLVLKQTGLSREEFYGSTKNTAKKINLRFEETNN